MEKAAFLLGSYVKDLERSEVISLSVRMIHGIKNELVKELDPTATIVNTPVQFTYVPTNVFFFYYAPLIIAHSSYHSTFSGIGGYHPAHVHGAGGLWDERKVLHYHIFTFHRSFLAPAAAAYVPHVGDHFQLLRGYKSWKRHRRLRWIHRTCDV